MKHCETARASELHLAIVDYNNENIMKKILVFGIAVFIAIVGYSLEPAPPLPPPSQVASIAPSIPATTTAPLSSNTYQVVKVVDGDTIDVRMQDSIVRLRLIGMDTPETVDPRKPVQCFGTAASDKAKALLEHATVRLEFDALQGVLDKYGRTLAYVFLASGTLFNEYMIAEGYAHEYTYNLPYKYQKEFKAAEQTAREEKKGLWADPSAGGCAGDTKKPAAS